MRSIKAFYGLMFVALFALASCGQGNRNADAPEGDIFDGRSQSERAESTGTSIFAALRRTQNESNISVNRYIWSASLEILDFLPLQEVDPFSGVIVTGFGTPPNGGRAYRATVLIRDPALEARSLSVSLQTRSGPASPATVRAVEDAILTRARQLRIQDNRL